MGEVIGQILATAVAVALSPVPIIAVILILFTPKARANGLAFVAGWVLGLVVVGSVILALGDVAADDGAPSTTTGVVKAILGVALLALAARNWRSRPGPDEEPELPGWMDALDDFGAGKSFGIAALLSGVNPKNFALTAAAASTIASAGLETGQEVGTLAVFIVVASITVAAPVVLYLAMGERAKDTLTTAKGWLGTNNATVMAVVLLIFGVKLIGDAITILS